MNCSCLPGLICRNCEQRSKITKEDWHKTQSISSLASVDDIGPGMQKLGGRGEDKLAEAIRALQFYANESSWQSMIVDTSFDGIHSSDIRSREVAPGQFHRFGGRRAHDALLKILGETK